MFELSEMVVAVCFYLNYQVQVNVPIRRRVADLSLVSSQLNWLSCTTTISMLFGGEAATLPA